MKIRYISYLFLWFALTIHAQDFSGLKIMINPGHGGNDSDDRFISTTGFWESESNLAKGLFLRDLLVARGAEVVISRVNNTTNDDLPLSQIVEMANTNNVDFFHSIHSNAFNGSVNYPLILYHGYDNDPTFPQSKDYARILWNQLYQNQAAHWTYNNMNIRGDFSFYGNTSGLGVLRGLNMPGVLSEGSFHDYIPESFRLVNKEYRMLESWNILKALSRYFKTGQMTTGILAGTIKDMNLAPEGYYYAPSSKDQYLTVNGAKASLYPGNFEYTTDTKNNGFFLFDSLPPGEYTLIIEADKYYADTLLLSVFADSIVYQNCFPEADHSLPPIVINWTPTGIDSINASSEITIRFSVAMNKVSTEAAFSITPEAKGKFTWSDGDKLLSFKPDLPLEKKTQYTVNLATTASHAWDVPLAEALSFGFITRNRNRIQLLESYPQNSFTEISPYLQFRLIFDAPINQASLIGNVLILNSAQQILPSKGAKIQVIDGKGHYYFLPKEPLAYNASFRLILNGSITDQDGNPLVDTLELSFATKSTEMNFETILEDFEVSGTCTILADSSLNYNSTVTQLSRNTATKMNLAASLKCIYQFTNDQGKLFIKTPDHPLDSNTDSLACWVFGDISHNAVSLIVQSGNQQHYLPLTTLNFAGYNLCFTHIPENIRGSSLSISGFLIEAKESGNLIGEVYFDALSSHVRTGITGKTSNTLRMYPNPARNYIVLEIPSESAEIISVEVFDLTGGRVMEIPACRKSNQQYMVPLPAIQTGIYFLRVKNRIGHSGKFTIIND